MLIDKLAPPLLKLIPPLSGCSPASTRNSFGRMRRLRRPGATDQVYSRLSRYTTCRLGAL